MFHTTYAVCDSDMCLHKIYCFKYAVIQNTAKRCVLLARHLFHISAAAEN